MQRSPVFRTAREAYGFLWHERRNFLSLASPAIVVLGILDTLITGLGLLAVPSDFGEGADP